MRARNALIGMTMVDLEGRFVEPDGRLCVMLGYSAPELSSMTLDEVTHADDIELDVAFMGQLLAGEIDHYELEKRYVRSDGTLLVGRLADLALFRGLVIDRHPEGRMADLIRQALDHDTVGVAYQPIFDLGSGALIGAEALLRLNDPAGRPMPPCHVIPAAEASGLIIDLGRRVLQMAARQTAAWHRQHGVLLPVSVNVSAAQLGREDFPHEVLNAVLEAGVPTRALILELTESVLLHTGSAGMEQLCALQQAGIELAIDDFGTGYTSLSLLHDLPAATLKVDQTFVAGIPHDERAIAIVAGVIALAENFGMSCIAEGIETGSQRAYLAERGVGGQGFLLGIPDGAAVIGRLIEATRTGARRPTDGPAAPRIPACGSPAPLDRIPGVYALEAGRTELTREMARARRTAAPLVLAVVAVDDLEATEQRSGAAAAHRLLREVATALKVAVRPYDLVIRDTSDQVVSAVAGSSLAEWEDRLRLVEADISARTPRASVRIGAAQMRADHSGPSLIARAQTAVGPSVPARRKAALVDLATRTEVAVRRKGSGEPAR